MRLIYRRVAQARGARKRSRMGEVCGCILLYTVATLYWIQVDSVFKRATRTMQCGKGNVATFILKWESNFSSRAIFLPKSTSVSTTLGFGRVN